MNIAYEPLSKNLAQPSDRRRFCAYAKARNIPFETLGQPGITEVAVLSQGSDLSRWVRAGKTPTRIVFDFIDSYLAEKRSFRRAFRGLAKFLTRRNRYLSLSYRNLLVQICKLADAVICSTEEQKLAIANLCPNVHLILDFHESDAIAIKEDYLPGSCFNIFWEGLPVNLPTLAGIVPVLLKWGESRPVALHAMTDLMTPLALGTMFPQSTKRKASKLFAAFPRIYLYEWNSALFSKVAVACDLGVIPIPMHVPQTVGKPENKLLLMWRMGLPVLTSPTPAYSRAMRAAGLDMTCLDDGEWLQKLTLYGNDQDARRVAGQTGRSYVVKHHNREETIQKWDDVFQSIGFPVAR